MKIAEDQGRGGFGTIVFLLFPFLQVNIGTSVGHKASLL